MEIDKKDLALIIILGAMFVSVAYFVGWQSGYTNLYTRLCEEEIDIICPEEEFNPEIHECDVYAFPEECYVEEGIYREPFTLCCDTWNVFDEMKGVDINLSSLHEVVDWCNEDFSNLELTCDRNGWTYYLTCIKFGEKAECVGWKPK